MLQRYVAYHKGEALFLCGSECPSGAERGSQTHLKIFCYGDLLVTFFHHKQFLIARSHPFCCCCSGLQGLRRVRNFPSGKERQLEIYTCFQWKYTKSICLHLEALSVSFGHENNEVEISIFQKIKSNGQKSVHRANFGFRPTFFLDLKNFERQVNSKPEEIKNPEKFLFHFQLTSRKEYCLVSGFFFQ